MKPAKIFLQILLIIAVAELLTMTVLSHFGVRDGAYAFIDTGMLLLLSAPFIHLWVVNGATRTYSLEAVLAKAALEREESMREKAESAERHFRELLGRLDAVVYEVDAATGRFSYVNERAEAILGYPVKRWTSEPEFWAGIIHPEDRDRVIEERTRATDRRREFRMGYRVVTANGRVIEVRDSLRVLRDAKDRPVRLQGVMLDLGEAPGSING